MANRVTTSSGERKGATNADKRRAEISRVAAELFHREGFSRTNVETIARAAGIEKPTLYHYFRSRAEIVAAIHDEVYDFINDRVEDSIASGASAPAVVKVLIRAIVQSMTDYPGYLEVYFNNHRELPVEAFRVAQAKRDRFESLVHAVIKRGVKDGSFQSQDTELTTLVLFGMCNWSNKWFGANSKWTVDEVTDYFFEFFMRGVFGQSAQPADAPAATE